VLAAEPISPLVARALYAPATLAAVTEYIALVGPRERVWMVHLACSLLSHLQEQPVAPPHLLRLGPRSVVELQRLVAVLRSQAHAQFALEDVPDVPSSPEDTDSEDEEEGAGDGRRTARRGEAHHKSALLQTLLQVSTSSGLYGWMDG
jgi:hypothetical protein